MVPSLPSPPSPLFCIHRQTLQTPKRNLGDMCLTHRVRILSLKIKHGSLKKWKRSVAKSYLIRVFPSCEWWCLLRIVCVWEEMKRVQALYLGEAYWLPRVRDRYRHLPLVPDRWSVYALFLHYHSLCGMDLEGRRIDSRLSEGERKRETESSYLSAMDWWFQEFNKERREGEKSVLVPGSGLAPCLSQSDKWTRHHRIRFTFFLSDLYVWS